MSEFLIKYLKKRYPSEQSAFEHSYLLSDVFETQNNQNDYITQFTAILNGKVIKILFNILYNKLLLKVVFFLKI